MWAPSPIEPLPSPIGTRHLAVTLSSLPQLVIAKYPTCSIGSVS
jgi:hypothetical protein